MDLAANAVEATIEHDESHKMHEHEFELSNTQTIRQEHHQDEHRQDLGGDNFSKEARYACSIY